MDGRVFQIKEEIRRELPGPSAQEFRRRRQEPAGALRRNAQLEIPWHRGDTGGLQPPAAGSSARQNSSLNPRKGLIVLFELRETRPAEAAHHASRTSAAQRFRQLKRAPVLLWFSLITLFFGMIYMQGNVTLPIDMLSHGLGPKEYGLAIAINGILIVLFTIPISNMAVRWPRFEIISIAAILSGVGFGFTAFADTLPLFALSVAIWTLGEIAATAVAPSIIADLSPVELSGLYQGIFGSAWGLAFFLGPILGGWAFEAFGPSSLR